jgi:LacI family transcriptional regulator
MPTPDTKRASRPVTIVDVAREAGVSPATASRAFNGSARTVRDANLKRVMAAAAKLSYAPNASAQAVVRGDTSTVALLISDITDPYFSWIAAGVIEAAEIAGLQVTVAVTNRNAARELDLVRYFRAQRPRAIIIGGSRAGSDERSRDLVNELTAFEQSGGKAVTVSQGELGFRSVHLNDRKGAAELARRMVHLGYQSFGIIAGPLEPGVASERVAGFEEGLASVGLKVGTDAVVRSAFSWEGGYEAAAVFPQEVIDGLDLIFAVNDMMALGAIAGLRLRGLRVPNDIALAGYDDIAPLRDSSPSLTTVRIPLKEVGAASVLLGLNDDERVATIEPLVVIRDSTPRR